MTLIIGCITEEFGVIAGDTQLSIGDISRGTSFRRETQLKIQRPSSNLMYGIMGKWSHYIPVESEKGMVTIINHYDLMARGVQNQTDQRKYITDFISGKSDIDGTVLFVEKDKKDRITINEISSLEDRELSNLTIGAMNFKFNEPFSNYNPNYIKSLISKFFQTNELSDSLVDVMFLLNNVQLLVISQGFSFNIVDESGVTQMITGNSVGGVVNLSVMTKDKHSWNKLNSPYNIDRNTLLDKSTYPFSRYVDNNKVVRYIDNLSMLVRSIFEPFNDNISGFLKELVVKQINYIVQEEIIDKPMMNELIEKINLKYHLQIDLFKKEKGENSLDIVFDNEELPVDVNFLTRFF